jgi:hypothetical protein
MFGLPVGVGVSRLRARIGLRGRPGCRCATPTPLEARREEPLPCLRKPPILRAQGSSGSAVDVPLPIRRDPYRGTRRRLVTGMRRRGGQFGTFQHVLALVVVEPVFTGLKALNVAMPGRMGVGSRVLAGRGIATADVAAFCAAT